MAKGRANPVLVIEVAAQYADSPPVESLRQLGHRIVVRGLDPAVDLILHPAAHQWNDMQWDFLPAALVAARKRKREAKIGTS